ncbi:transglutaminase-like putative cysteine protease [Alkalibacillus flavidus]|uniref:Transglutaminase-like putative cysteine protease n=1 Tax=Alkalibacillus flavidus TaxID=546021 RepID=A0ABV2KXD9_9BACI
MRLKLDQSNRWVTLALYIGSMLLLMEWVYPLNIVTDTGETHVFMVFIVLMFALSLLQLPVGVVSTIKGFMLLVFVHYLFVDTTFFSFEWIGLLAQDMMQNIVATMQQNWQALTPLFRTILFLLLLWMLSYLLYYWFVVVKRPFAFILLTVLYVTALDTFTLYEANTAIVRVFVLSALLLVLANFHRIVEKESLALPQPRQWVKWLAPMMFVIGISAAIGYAAPKYEPQWPDPVSFIQAASAGGFGDGPGDGGIRRVGYGENDDRLGGGFQMDDTTVFLATANSPRYWKVETKDVYTGLGWQRSSDGETIANDAGQFPEMSQYGDVVGELETDFQLQMVEPGNLTKLPYIYGTDQVGTDQTGINFEYNPITGELLSLDDGEQMLVEDSYSFEATRPDFPRNAMRQVPVEYNSESGIDEGYLQLPEDLPERVSALAEEIVAEEDQNRYDYAAAIEDYFSRNNFQYATDDVAVPDEDEDYVDQFLFETQRGYCDNFSTSMVVMLRSLDIPARWAKGFTGGDRAFQQETFPDAGSGVFEVENNNAHSWVEVYFPDVGWVPFEPTVGFQNQASFSTGESIEDILEDNEDDTLDQPDSSEQSDVNDQLDEGSDEDETGAAASGDGPTISLWTTVIVSVIVVVTGGLVFYYRDHLTTAWRKRQLKHHPNQSTITQSYQFVMKLLAKEGYPFKPGETLREYASQADRVLDGKSMSELTQYYERFVYRDESLDARTSDYYQVWTRVTDQILSK